MPDTADQSPQSLDFLVTRGADWLASVATRHSRRSFDGSRLPNETLDAVLSACERFTPYPDARMVLVREPATDIFRGAIGSYGKVKGAPHVLVFVGDERSPFADQHVGYTGEGVILEAAALGLDTCWVAGFFDPKAAAQLVTLSPGERIYAVSPLGHSPETISLSERGMRGLAGAHKRKVLATIAPGAGSDEGWPQWARAAVETARLAPSAVNRQPWRFRMESGALVISKDGAAEMPKVTKRLDCGIAMLHAEIGARASGVSGRWTDLEEGLDVARFVPATS